MVEHDPTGDKNHITPPDVNQKEYQVSLHGKSWNDPYHWLRDKDNEEVIEYLQAENSYTEHALQHTQELQDKLFEEMKNRIKETDQSVPTTEGEYYYYTRTVKGQEYPIYCRKKGNSDREEEILLDVNKLAEDKEYTAIGSFEVSPDHNILAYSVDFSGYEDYDIYFVDLQLNNLFSYQIKDTGGLIAWVNNTGIYYNLRDDIHRSYQIQYHELNSPTDDLTVYEEENEEFAVWMSLSTDKKLLILNSHGRESDIIHYVDIESNHTKPVQFNNQIDQVEYRMDHHFGFLYFLTSKDAVNFRFCRTPVGVHEEENWEELISHNPEIQLSRMKMFADFGVIQYRQGGYSNFRVFTIPEFNDHSIKLPEEIHAVHFHNNPNFETSFFRFEYSSPVTPTRVYDYTISTKELDLQKEEKIYGYEPEKYLTRREYAIARDGTKIPISIAYKKEVDKPAPMLLYGYGSYGASIDPGFGHLRISLLQRGIIFAIAHIRGGGEMGKIWYHDGKLLNKTNTFYDFIDTAKFLTDAGYTTTNQLAIQGVSAGGLLMGAVTNIAPDLFKTVIARVPFVDVINTMIDTSIPLTTFEFLEWGNPTESKEFFDYMYSYSPYDLTGVTTTSYPELLITAGLNDPRVHYWEPAKWTAKLRDIKTDDNRVLLKTNMGAGHGGASGRYDYMKEMAFIYSFLIDSLEMPLE